MEITGRVTADATVTTVKGDKQVVNFTIGIYDSYKPKGASEPTEIKTYINCSYWLNSNTAKVLRKGAIVEVTGRIGMNVYNNMDGKAVGSLTFHTNTVKVLASAKKQDNAGSAGNMPVPAQTGQAEAIDDLPF